MMVTNIADLNYQHPVDFWSTLLGHPVHVYTQTCLICEDIRLAELTENGTGILCGIQMMSTSRLQDCWVPEETSHIWQFLHVKH